MALRLVKISKVAKEFPPANVKLWFGGQAAPEHHPVIRERSSLRTKERSSLRTKGGRSG